MNFHQGSVHSLSVLTAFFATHTRWSLRPQDSSDLAFAWTLWGLCITWQGRTTVVCLSTPETVTKTHMLSKSSNLLSFFLLPNMKILCDKQSFKSSSSHDSYHRRVRSPCGSANLCNGCFTWPQVGNIYHLLSLDPLFLPCSRNLFRQRVVQVNGWYCSVLNLWLNYSQSYTISFQCLDIINTNKVVSYHLQCHLALC